MAKQRSGFSGRKVQYLSGATGELLEGAVAEGLEVGLLAQPKSGYGQRLPLFRDWAADNGSFTTDPKGFQPHLFRAMLNDPRFLEAQDRCLFVVVPDALEVIRDAKGKITGVIGHAQATLDTYADWALEIRALGYRTALVAQDGLEDLLDQVQWELVDVLFIGGSTEWKLSAAAAACVAEARRQGKRVHMGRVNSGLRLGIAADMGCDTADGTYLGFGPRANFPRMLRWPNLLKEAPAPVAPAAAAFEESWDLFDQLAA